MVISNTFSHFCSTIALNMDDLLDKRALFVQKVPPENRKPPIPSSYSALPHPHAVKQAQLRVQSRRNSSDKIARDDIKTQKNTEANAKVFDSIQDLQMQGSRISHAQMTRAQSKSKMQRVRTPMTRHPSRRGSQDKLEFEEKLLSLQGNRLFEQN